MADPVYDVYAFIDYRWQLVKQFQGRQRDAAVEYAEFVYREKHVLAYRVIEEIADASGEIRERKVANKKKVDTLPKRPPPTRVAPRNIPGAQARGPAAGSGAKTAAPVEPSQLSQRGRQAITMLLIALAIGAVAVLLVFLNAVGALSVVSSGALTALGAGFAAATAAGLGMLATAPDERGLIMRQVFSFLSESESKPQPAGPPPTIATTTAPVAPPEPEMKPLELEPSPEALVQLDADDPDSQVSPERHRSLLAVVHGFVTVARAWIGKLLGQPGAAEHNQITAHMRFGIHLFLAGLCEQSGKLKQWDEHEQRFVLAESLAQLFNDQQSARRFAGNFQEYLAEPRYMDMYKAGLTWDGQLSEGMPAGPGLVDRWVNKSDGRAVEHISVMFTDIIGSTAFTQIHGDKLQMELVQAHDRIVRQAVEDHHGRWVKHTGDGAMLAFDKPLEAVRAAVQIQSEVKVHNEIMPALPLKLRVGISAGQPIKAGEDLFGSTVQLSARVCALAEAGQVVVSAAVSQACEGTGFAFFSLGSRELKGFPEPQAIYAVNMG